MASVGQLGGLNYKITPFGQPVAAPGYTGQDVGAIAPPEVAGLPNDRLADRQGQTEELFNKYRMLDSFAKDMAKKGIDVFTPDYSEPGGGLPYQTFLQLDAGVRYAANKLANQQKAQDQFLPEMFQGGARLAQGKTMETVDLTDPNQIVSLRDTPAIDEAQRRLGADTNTQREANALNQQVFDRSMAAIDAEIASGAITPEQGAVRKASLFRNVPTPQVFAPRAESGGR